MTTRDKGGRNSNDVRERGALHQGTLDLLILQTLAPGSHRGQRVARAIQRQSEEAFLIDYGSFYLAQERPQEKPWVSAKWGISENNRKARFYTLTAKSRAELTARTEHWHRLAKAFGFILNPEY